ncbi:MAG: ABC transporter ATP-binding protein [Sphaerochaetaceae bacterium]
MSVEVKNLSFKYAERPILENISFKAEQGQITSLLGANGAGKSTLFKCILGLFKHYKGDIIIEDKKLKNLNQHELSRMIAYVPQSSYPSFNYSVFEMVLMGTSSSSLAWQSPGLTQKKVVEEALKDLGIYYLKDREYQNLSGGERQLVLIARAIAQNTKVLILDEITANLDYGNQLEVLEKVKNLAIKGLTVILSTHNPEQAFMFSDRIVALQDKKILANGDPKIIMDSALIKKMYKVDVEMVSLYKDKIRFMAPTFMIN